MNSYCRNVIFLALLGILEREQENAVQYGSVDFGKTVQWDDEFARRLVSVAKWFHIDGHDIVNHDEKTLNLLSSVELKVSWRPFSATLLFIVCRRYRRLISVIVR